tara:strand:- start:48 stop:839 length:792 start_codon:yes stop_codon:yes gene_type:complete
MKTCIHCKKEKEFTEYPKRKDAKDGFSNQCKECRSKSYKKWKKENKDKVLENRKKDYQKNKERYKRKSKEWSENNKECKKEYDINYYIKNKDARRKNTKKWYLNNKEYASSRGKIHYKKNREIYLLKGKKYYEKNKVKIKIYSREYAKEKRKTNPLFKLKCTLRGRTRSAFKAKGYKKDSMTGKMLGVDWEICKSHMERQFEKGMNWSNHGEWHIDHIIPLASAKTEKELIKLCHYSNLQPLWAFDNISKSNKINGQQNKLRL